MYFLAVTLLRLKDNARVELYTIPFAFDDPDLDVARKETEARLVDMGWRKEAVSIGEDGRETRTFKHERNPHRITTSIRPIASTGSISTEALNNMIVGFALEEHQLW